MVYVVLLVGHPSSHYLETSSFDEPDDGRRGVPVMAKGHVIVSRAGRQKMSWRY